MKIKDKFFDPFIKEIEIQKRILSLAKRLSADYEDKEPLFLAILNGSFVFAADLLRAITIPVQISFIRLSSYDQLQSTGNVKEIIGLNENLFQRDIIILEDIIDTGLTLSYILEDLKNLGANSIEIVTLLLKPEKLKTDLEIKYKGFEIPEDFIVGYGLDYDGYGRNLKEIYKIKE
ncbi:hypoxanthine phosphoribosyltransferase [Bacteroidota bacterium]